MPKSGKLLNTEEVIGYSYRYPTFTNAQIAGHFGTTRQAVNLLLKREKVRSKAIRPERSKRTTCPLCGSTKVPQAKVCSKCFHSRTGGPTNLICDECGKVVPMPPSRVSRFSSKGQVHFFCSKKCQGKYAGENWGWGSPDKKIVNPDNVVELLESGSNTTEISRKLGTSVSNIHHIALEKGYRNLSSTKNPKWVDLTKIMSNYTEISG